MDGGVLSTLGTGAGALTAGIVIALGLVACFFGYRLLRIVLAILGFILGALLGFVVATSLGAGDTVALVAALVGGLIGAALLAFVYKLGVFLVGAVAGAVLGGIIGASLGGSLQIAAVVVAAVLVGIVAVLFQRVVIILATAFTGSWVVVQAGTALISGRTITSGDLLTNPSIPQLAGAALVGFVAVWAVLKLATPAEIVMVGEPVLWSLVFWPTE